MGDKIEEALNVTGSKITHARELINGAISKEQLQSEIDEIACDLEGFQDQLTMPSIPQGHIDAYNNMINDLEDLTAVANIKFKSMFADLSHNLERLGEINLATLQEQANKRIQDLQQAIETNGPVEEIQQRIFSLEAYLASIESAIAPDAQDVYNTTITKATELRQQASSLIEETMGYAQQTSAHFAENLQQQYVGNSFHELEQKIAGRTTQIQADIASGTQAGKEAAANKLQYMHEQIEAAKVQFGELPGVARLEVGFKSLSTSFSTKFTTAFATIAALGTTVRSLSPFVSRTTRELRLEVKNERYGFYGVELELEKTAHQAHVEKVITKIDGESTIQQLSIEVTNGPQNMDSLLNYLEASKDITLDDLLAGTPEQQMAGELAYQLSCNAIGGVIHKHRREQNPDWETKGFNIDETKKAFEPELASLESISGTHLDRHEQRLVQLVNTGGVLAGSLKREFSTMKNIEVEGHMAMMAAYNKTLGLSPQERTRMQKFGDALVSGGNKLKEFMRDPLFDGKLDKKDIAPALGLLGGGILLLKGIAKLWSREDAESNDDAESDDNIIGWLRKRMWKILGALGLGAVAYGVYKHWDNKQDKKAPNEEIDGTNALFDPVPGDPEGKDFHKLPAVEVANANLAAQQANKLMMTENFGGASYEQVDGEAISSGVLCAILQKNYGSIGNILSSETYYKLYAGNNLNTFWRMLRNSGQEHVAQVVGRLKNMLPASGIAAILTSLPAGKIVDKLEERSAESDTNQAAVFQIFRKQTGLVSYVYYQREQYKQKLALQYLTQQHTDRASYDLEKQQTLMDEFISNEGLYATHIAQPLAVFDAKPLINLTYARETSALTFLSEVGLLNDQVDLFHQDEYDELVTELEGFTKDEDGENLLAESGLFDGENLTEDGESRTLEVIDNIEEHKDTLGQSRWYEYLGFARLFSHEDDTTEQLESMYGDIMEPLMVQMTIYKQKIVDGTFTPADKLALENTITSYRGYMRQLQLTSYAISDIKENADGSIIVTAENIGSAILQNGFNMREGASRVIGALGLHHPKMRYVFNAEQVKRMKTPLTRGQKISEMLKGTAQIGVPLATIYYIKNPGTLLRHAGTAVVKTISLTMRTGYGLGSLATRGVWKGGSFSLGARWYYRGLSEEWKLKKFMYNAVRGRHGNDLAKLAEVAFQAEVYDGAKRIKTIEQLLPRMFNNYEDKSVGKIGREMVKKYFSHPKLRRQIYVREIGRYRNPLNYWKGGRVIFDLDIHVLNSLKKCDAVVKNLSGNELKVAQRMMNMGVLKAEKIITKFPNLSKILLHIHPNGVTSLFDSMRPRELASILQKLESADDLTDILKFMQKANISAADAPIVFTNAMKSWKSIKANPMDHLDMLRQTSGAKGLLERMRNTKTAEVFRNLADNLRKKLRNPTLPVDAAGRQMIEHTIELAEEVAVDTTLVRAFDDIDGGTATATRTTVSVTETTTQTAPQVSKVARMKAKIRNMPNGAKLGAILNVVGCAVALYAAGQTQDLANSYEGINDDKARLFSSKAGNERAMAIVFAGIGVGLAMSGVGLPIAIVLGVAEAGISFAAYAANEAYFKTIDAYETNREERIREGCEVKEEAKQHIMAIIAGEYDLERSRSEAFARFWKNNEAFFAKRADKTIDETMFAWVLLDEVDRSGSELMRATFIGGVGFDDPNITTINDRNPEGIDGAERANQVQLIKDKVRLRIAYIASSVGKTTRSVTETQKEVKFNPYDTHGDGLTTTYRKINRNIEVLDWPGFLKEGNTDMQTAFSRLMLESTVAISPQALETSVTQVPEDVRGEMITLGECLGDDPDKKGKCIALFNENREYMVYLASAMSNYIYNFGPMIEDDESLAIMRANEQYLWEYIEYARWYYGWELPSYAGETFEHDVTFIKNFALTLDIDTSATAVIAPEKIDDLTPKNEAWMLEHMHTSSSVVQNVLFDIARQVYGMHVQQNDMEALSLIFSESRKDQHGIYVSKIGDTRKIAVNDAGWAYYDWNEDMGMSNQLEILDIFRNKIHERIDDENLVETKSGSGEGIIGRAVGNKYVGIIDTYRNRLRVNEGNEIKPNFASIYFALDTCACDAGENYFQLPLHVIADMQMLGLTTAGEYVYRKTLVGTYEARHIETGEMYESSGTSGWGWKKKKPNIA